jgi:peptidyl-prolyl cis-trans isomerase C
MQPVRTFVLPAVVSLHMLATALPASAGEFVPMTDGKSTISIPEVRLELEGVPADVRARVGKAQMQRFVESQLSDRRIAEAAEKAGIANQGEVKQRIVKARRDVIIKAYMDAQVAKIASELPKDLDSLGRERYERDKDAYKQAEAIRAAHILVVPGDNDAAAKAKAEKLLGELKGGANFAELAKANSDDKGSAGSGGELPGWMEKGKLVPAFEKVAYELKPNELSSVVKSQYGYHIIKLLEHRPAKVMSFDEVKDQVVDAVRKQLVSERRTEWLKQFLGTKPVELDDATYEALKKPD